MSTPIRRLYYKLLLTKGPIKPLARGIAHGVTGLYYFGARSGLLKPDMDCGASVVVSHRYRFISIGVPKTATRSIRDALIAVHDNNRDVEWREHRHAIAWALKRFPEYYVFSFVRNPWDRILSCYHSKIARPSFKKRARIMAYYDGLYAGMPFEAFAQWLATREAGQDAIADRHWLSQYRFLYDAGDRPLCHYVGRFEDLDADMSGIARYLGMPPVRLEKAGWVSAEWNNKDAHYRNYYNDITRAHIAQRYATDIARFGYKF